MLGRERSRLRFLVLAKWRGPHAEDPECLSSPPAPFLARAGTEVCDLHVLEHWLEDLGKLLNRLESSGFSRGHMLHEARELA